MGERLTVEKVGSLSGFRLPGPRGRCKCPFRSHGRQDKTFRVWISERTKDEIWKCWSCDLPNSGDAVELYARLNSCTRTDAWGHLKQRGFDVPGLNQERSEYVPTPQQQQRVEIPLRGSTPEYSLPLDQEKWHKWHELRTGAVERFAEMRCLDAAILREHDVIDMPGGKHIGFTYFDGTVPCRVKVRAVEEKRFFVEPRSQDGHRKALAPLYLANELSCVEDKIRPAIITEGEVDALSLVQLGFKNVVSLPDGSESASTVDLGVLFGATSYDFNFVLAAFDYEDPSDPKWKNKLPPGVAGFRSMRSRTCSMSKYIDWIKWSMFVGDEPVIYKDANAALMAGHGKEDFVKCLDIATQNRFGFTVKW